MESEPIRMLRSNYKNNLIHFWPTFVYILVVLVIVFLFYKPVDNDLSYRYVFLGFFSLIIPQIILHTRYWFLSRGIELIINSDECLITYKTSNKNITLRNSDIEHIKTPRTYHLNESKISLFTWDIYCYSIITLYNGEKLLITSLILPAMEWPLFLKQKEVAENCFFCWIE